MISEEILSYQETHGHFGLVITPQTFAFAAANPLSLRDDQLPAVDIAALPDSLGVASWMQIEDQAQQGSCQGHARTSAGELGYYRETGSIIQLNRQFAYITSQLEDGFRSDVGSTLEGGASAAKKYGEALESLWPYSGRYDRNIPQACYEDAKNRKLRTSMVLENYDQVLRWLVHGLGGIVIGILWNGSAEPDSQGVVSNYRPSGRSGHALAWLDWTKKFSDRGRPFIQLANSWGKRWGVNGWSYWSPDAVDLVCRTQTVVGYSDLDGPDIRPRLFDYDSGRVIA